MTWVLCAAVMGAACASSRGAESARETSRSARRDINVITREQLEQSSARDAYHAVQLLRPEWLRTRGISSLRDPVASEAVVYLDGQRFGTLQSLEQFKIDTIKEMRYYSGTEATNRWGTGHGGGVVFVTSR